MIEPSTTKHWPVDQRAKMSARSYLDSVTAQPFHFEPRIRRSHRGRDYSERARRFLNILVASIAIIITAPVMLVVALLVKLTSPGPVIYKQARVGLDRRGNRGPGSENFRRGRNHGGRLFTIYKFRTMRNDPTAGEQWASRNDPRITPLGAFLRATRIDELPQFFNVIKGDMNIVGPRPEQPQIFSELRQNITRYSERQRVLPGITGLAQVELGYDTSIDDVKKKVDLDLQYIERRSPTEDLVIMAKTMPVMVFRRGWM
jgi:lipopolysaccharide/colanic/teichoic acid biosynthesis glycosyltransferase